MAKTELTADDKFELLLQALTAKQETGITPEVLKDILSHNATAVQKAMRPENDTHPGFSVFSHPDGDQAHPKATLPFECFINGYPVHQFPETETWAEWELYHQLQPGEYTVIRKDGTPMAVTVKGERDANGNLTKVLVEFPIQRSERELVPPKSVLLYQLIHNENPLQAFRESMMAYIDRMVQA